MDYLQSYLKPRDYECRNYRAGSSPSKGVVLADLHHPDTGEFYRTAAVADCGSLAAAKAYAKEANQKNDKEAIDE